MKRIMLLILSGLLTASLLAACNTQEVTSSNATSTNSTVSDEISDTDTTTDLSDAVISGGFTQEYEYNDDNQISKVMIYNEETGELKAEVHNEYNEDGDLEIITLKDSTGKTRCKNIYEYAKDPDGNNFISKDTYYDENENKVLYVAYEYSEENKCPISLGYFDGEDKELENEDANKIIEGLNSFMHE